MKKQDLYLLFVIRNELLEGMLVPCFGQVSPEQADMLYHIVVLAQLPEAVELHQ